MPDFYEFFAGGGMARAGLGPAWRCLFANDLDPKKSRMYRENWNGGAELRTADVATLTVTDLPGAADLAWASFPCQDLSLAGAGAGLKGHRSGTFWPFWNLMKALNAENRAPRLIVLENVCGALTSHEGKDFAAICDGFEHEGYAVGALVMDAQLFLPQSRPRLFIVGVRGGSAIPDHLTALGPCAPWHTPALRTAHGKLSSNTKAAWRWWNPPLPPRRKLSLADLIEENPASTRWFTAEAVRDLLDMMSDVNRAKVAQAKREGRVMVGGLYRRTRPDGPGKKRVQRAEVRFDGVSGCLRTPAGGSSRQALLIVDGRSVRARLISSRETARLMGLPDSYKLPENYNEAYHLTGDGVVVPVVRHLAKNIIEPILDASDRQTTAAA